MEVGRGAVVDLARDTVHGRDDEPPERRLRAREVHGPGLMRCHHRGQRRRPGSRGLERPLREGRREAGTADTHRSRPRRQRQRPGDERPQSLRRELWRAGHGVPHRKRGQAADHAEVGAGRGRGPAHLLPLAGGLHDQRHRPRLREPPLPGRTSLHRLGDLEGHSAPEAPPAPHLLAGRGPGGAARGGSCTQQRARWSAMGHDRG
mmetsp:Transcript_114196/g.303541  ORF Transcript_114196/g.303541 Transcript_114196/m.303541 type:complete len:205 (+) Transcript_114196:106-720(+)